MQGKPSRQSGMTMIGFLLMFMLIGFFTLLVIKILPLYLEHFKIVSSLESIRKEPNWSNNTKEEIQKMLQRRWDVNSVDTVTANKDVEVTRQNGRVKVRVAYEAVTHIMGNVDVLLTFDDVIESEPN
jgi:hypothetical protein